MLLRTLGGLSVEGTSFRRPKPLLLLSHLAIEGPADRGRLATMFWPDHDRPRQNLAVAVSQLNAGVPGALAADNGRLVAQVECDARQLLAAMTVGDWRRALQVHCGPFLDSYPVAVGEELEGWILDTRDYPDGLFGSVLIEGALAQHEEGEPHHALELAERAYRLFEAGVELEPGRLRLLHSALSRLGSPHAVNLMREAEGLGLDFTEEPVLRSPASPSATRTPRLPPRPTSSLIGRERELGDLRTLIEQGARLITVTGFSGVGKSRLALEYCHEAVTRQDFERVIFVPMEPVSHADTAFGHLASSIGFTLTPGDEFAPCLARHLDDQPTLLVLDNMEHLVPWAAQLEELAAFSERLVVLTTSTQPMAKRDETLFFLEGLELTPTFDDPRTPRCAAVRYFEERVRRAIPAFSTEADIGAIWRICAAVGGLPLGLELAAGLARVLSLPDLAERLEERPEEIAAVAATVRERHRSLVGLCEHAWAFLKASGRSLLAALSVFKESFSVPDLEAVCGPALVDLALLERRSLVTSNGDRYALHPLIRRFAEARLADDPVADQTVRDKHAEHIAHTLHGLANLSSVKNEGEALRAGERALPDAMAAWRWSVERGAEENLVRLLDILVRVLDARGRNALLHELIETALDRIDPLSSAAARLHLTLGDQAYFYDVPKAREHIEAALLAASASNDNYARGRVEIGLLAVETAPLHLPSTQAAIRRALKLQQEAQAWEAVADCYRLLGLGYASVRRNGSLLALGMRSMRRSGFLSGAITVSFHMAMHLTDTCGDHRAALEFALSQLSAELDGPARPYALLDLYSLAAYFSLNAGDLDEARRLNAEALKLTRRRSEAPKPVYPAPEMHWATWAAPLVALHTEGSEAALREGLSQYQIPETRDLLVHVLLASGDREGAEKAATKLRFRSLRHIATRFRLLAQALSHRLRATLADDDEASRKYLAAALRLCAEHHFVPLALDCVVSCHHLFPELVCEDEALEVATHPAAYHSAQLFLTKFSGTPPSKVDRAPFPVDEALLRSALLADQLEVQRASRLVGNLTQWRA